MAGVDRCRPYAKNFEVPKTALFRWLRDGGRVQPGGVQDNAQPAAARAVIKHNNFIDQVAHDYAHFFGLQFTQVYAGHTRRSSSTLAAADSALMSRSLAWASRVMRCFCRALMRSMAPGSIQAVFDGLIQAVDLLLYYAGFLLEFFGALCVAAIRLQGFQHSNT